MMRALLQCAVGCSSLLVASAASATLVKHWTLDGAGPYADEVTGNASNTVDAGAISNNQAGIAPDGGTSILFANDGGNHLDAGTVQSNGDYVALGADDSTYTVLKNQYAITAWVRLAETQTSGGDRVIFSVQFSSTQGMLFGVNNGTGATGNRMFVDFGNISFDSNISLETNKDYFVALIADTSSGVDTVGGGTNKSRIAVYDVVAQSWTSQDDTRYREYKLQNMTIGAFRNDFNAREFEGNIDDMRLYDNAFTLEELDALVNVNPAIPGDTDGDGDIDDSDLGTSFANYTGPVGDVGKTAAEGDTDGDGDVDDSDLGTSFSAYTGPLGPASVPEPASLALLGLGGLLVACRRRG